MPRELDGDATARGRAATAPAAISPRRRRCGSATKAARALVGQLLIYPVTDYHTPGTPSYRENAEGYGLTRDTMVWFWDHYLTDAVGGSRSLRVAAARARSCAACRPRWW